MTALLPDPLEYVPYREVRGRPNIIVDGPPQDATVLTLSHWPVNTTPDSLKRDTSTATVFAYLDAPSLHAHAECVSNNHFDEDGLFSMFALHQPETAIEHRELLQDAALAGDFGTYTDLEAARLCFVIEAFADQRTSPLPPGTFAGCERQQVASLYRRMLDRLPEILVDIDGFKACWSEPDAHLAESEALIADGRVKIEEYPELDLAVVMIPEDLSMRTVRRYLQSEQGAVHPFAIHNATDCNRIIRAQGGRLEFQYRYDSWLQVVSRRPLLRADLSALAERLNAIESAHGTWRSEKITQVVPRLYLEGTEKSELPLERFIDEVRAYLTTAPVAWDPYDWDPRAVSDRDEC